MLVVGSLAALHEAAVSGHVELTQLLTEHGAAVDVLDNEGLAICLMTSRICYIVIK